MKHNIRDYWVAGLVHLTSTLRNTEEQSVSENGSVSALKRGIGDTYSFGSLIGLSYV
jgi:hypothetical protein